MGSIFTPSLTPTSPLLFPLSSKFECTIFARSLNSSGIASNDSTISSSSKSNNPSHLRIASLDGNKWFFLPFTFLATVLQLSQRASLLDLPINTPIISNKGSNTYCKLKNKTILRSHSLSLSSRNSYFYLYNSYDSNAHPPHAFPHPKQHSQVLSVSSTLVNTPYPQYETLPHTFSFASPDPFEVVHPTKEQRMWNIAEEVYFFSLGVYVPIQHNFRTLSYSHYHFDQKILQKNK